MLDLNGGRDQYGSTFGDLSSAFSSRLAELKGFANLRVDDHSKGLFQQDLLGLQASVRALEAHLAQLKRAIQSENAAIPKVHALISACKAQGLHLQGVAAVMPSLMAAPSVSASQQLGGGGRGQSGADRKDVAGTSSARNGWAGEGPSQAARSGSSSARSGHGLQPAQSSDEPSQVVRKKREPPARWFLSQAELDNCSSYMKGRLTLEKVNAAVSELAAHAEANWRLVTAARSSGTKMTAADRKRATELLHGVTGKEGVRGYHFVMEHDLRDGQALKLDKTGRSILTLLRHVGRLQEVRCNVEGTTTLIYTLQQPQS